jgi:O-antigen/teichoic acid export membrane protein
MFAGLIWNIITTFLNYMYARNIVEIRFLFDYEYIKKIFITSIPYWIAIFLWVIYMKIDIILLSLMESPETANISIALYSVPMKIMEVFMVTGTFFLNSMLPWLSNAFKNKDQVVLQNNIKTSYIFLLLGSVFMLTFWLAFKDIMVQTIANADYLDRSLYVYTSSDAFIIVLFMIIFYFMFLIFQYIFIASENQWKLLKINIYITLFNIIWNIIMIPKYSFVWAWIVTVISQFLLMLLWYYYSRDIIRFKIPRKITALVVIWWTVLYIFLDHIAKFF